MAEKTTPFLKRWSNLKQEENKGFLEPAGDGPETDEGAEAPGPEKSEAEIVAELPDIDKLDADSDYTAFLQEGVPDELKRLALKALWRSSPELANLDGLNDYDEDYSILEAVVETVKSAYQAGKGYVDEEDEADDSQGEDAADDGAANVAGDDDTEEKTAPQDAVVKKKEGETSGLNEGVFSAQEPNEAKRDDELNEINNESDKKS